MLLLYWQQFTCLRWLCFGWSYLVCFYTFSAQPMHICIHPWYSSANMGPKLIPSITCLQAFNRSLMIPFHAILALILIFQVCFLGFWFINSSDYHNNQYDLSVNIYALNTSSFDSPSIFPCSKRKYLFHFWSC